MDSFDTALLHEFEADLPNFRALRSQSPDFKYKSTQPPDSHTAWPSIYTGENPAEHGIVDFVDPLEKSSRKLGTQVDNSPIRGKTFWDDASRAGKRVCVLFPHVGFPPWPVNGLMVARDEVAGEVRAVPPTGFDARELGRLMVLTGMPAGARSLSAYVRAGHRLVDAEAKFSLAAHALEPWDLFFTYSSVADWFCHYFWNYSDPSDPSYPGPNKFANTIRDLYVHYDEVLGKYRAAAPDATFIVVSDHGHGLRPPTVVNLNRVLFERGWYTPRSKTGSTFDRFRVLENARRGAARFISRHAWTWNGAKRVIKLAPAMKRFYTSPPTVDWDRTIAYVSDQSGIKAYNYGGVMINRKLVADARYEPLRDSISEAILAIRHPETGERLVHSCIRREELYRGRFISKYPDLVFELVPGYGAGWSPSGPLLEPAETHSISPGSHRRDTALLLVSDKSAVAGVQKEIQPMDVREIILRGMA